MIQNILPTEEKKKIVMTYRTRLAVVILFALVLLVTASLALLVPSYLFAVSKYNLAQEELARLEANTSNSAREKDIAAQVQEVNKHINVFLKSSEGGWLLPSEITKKVLGVRGSEIKLSGFTYNFVPEKEQVIISGIASNRDSLAVFVDALKKEPMFTEVTIPISSYVKSTNINFSVIITHSTKEEITKQ